MKDEELLTKEEIARELVDDGQEPLSIRSVERYINLAGVSPAVKGSGRGKQAKFSRDDVVKIKAAYKAAAETRGGGGTSLTRAAAGGVQRAAAVAELERNTEALTGLRAALDPWPVWMTKAQALRRSGLPASWFNSGARSGELPHVGEGRGRRFHRDEVRAFAERVRESSYVAGLARPRPKGKKKR